MTKPLLEAAKRVSVLTASQLLRSNSQLGRAEVVNAITPFAESLAAKNRIIGFGDYHCDNEFRLFTAQMMPLLREAGYKRLYLEYPQDGQKKLDAGLKFFAKGVISFDRLSDMITFFKEPHWRHTEHSQALFTAVVASAYLHDIEVIGMDKTGSTLRERNDIWARKIQESLESKIPSIVVGGAAHFAEPNSQADLDAPEWDDDHVGVDGRIMSANPDLKFSTFITRKPVLRQNELIAPRGKFEIKATSPNYYCVTLPQLSEREIDEALKDCLGEYYTHEQDQVVSY